MLWCTRIDRKRNYVLERGLRNWRGAGPGGPHCELPWCSRILTHAQTHTFAHTHTTLLSTATHPNQGPLMERSNRAVCASPAYKYPAHPPTCHPKHTSTNRHLDEALEQGGVPRLSHLFSAVLEQHLHQGSTAGDMSGTGRAWVQTTCHDGPAATRHPRKQHGLQSRGTLPHCRHNLLLLLLLPQPALPPQARVGLPAAPAAPQPPAAAEG